MCMCSSVFIKVGEPVASIPLFPGLVLLQFAVHSVSDPIYKGSHDRHMTSYTTQ